MYETLVMVKIWMRKYDKINPAGNPGLRVVLNSGKGDFEMTKTEEIYE